MNTPLSFVPDSAPSTPSSFVPDQQSKPASFVPDSSPVLNQNTTGFGLRQNSVPSSYGDAMAMRSPMDVQSPGEGTSFSDIGRMAMSLPGKATLALLNSAAQKDLPDERNQYPAYLGAHGTAAPHLRNFLQKGLFGPSNLSVLGKDPNQQINSANVDNSIEQMLPGTRPMIGQPTAGQTLGAASMLLPLGVGPETTLGKAVLGYFGAKTVEQMPENVRQIQEGLQQKNYLQAGRAGVDTLLGGAMLGMGVEGLHGEPVNRPNMNHMNGPVDMSSLQDTLAKNQISRSAPTAKEVTQPVVPLQSPLPNDISLPESTTEQVIPEGGDNSGTATVSKQMAEPSGRGTLSPVDFKAAPVTFKGEQKGFGPVKDFNLYDLNEDIPGHTKGSTVGGPELEKLGYRLPEQVSNKGMNPESGSVGLHVLDPEVWKELGFKAKVGGEQFINRLRNKLGGESAGWKMIDTPELKAFMQEPRTTQEVQAFVNSKGPKLEVRKFGQGSAQTPEQVRFAQLEHIIDSHPEKRQIDKVLTYEEPADYEKLSEAAKKIVDEFRPLNKVDLQKGVEASHWQSIAPKSEQDMPGYTEIAVVKPTTKSTPDSVTGYVMEKHQFPSSHFFPPNTLGFVRGYMETTPQGKKVFHVIEVQSDWAQQVREEKELAKSQKLEEPSWSLSHDPLLPHYERLALKAAIDHAREQGAEGIAISDAETAMMTEGHDRQPTVVFKSTPENVARAKNLLKTVNGVLYQSDLNRIANGEHFYTDNQAAQKYIKYGFKPEAEPQITQAEGMRLHYDKTLPKIAEELTGEKGTKESFGEHRMAREYPVQATTRPEPGELRKDLIFRNESGEPKTDITARIYPITKAAKDFSIIGKDKPVKQVGNQGVSGESGMVDLSGARESLQKGIENLKEYFSDEGIRRKTMKMAGVSVPRTTAANEAVGNQLTMFAQAEGVAEAKARSMASEVLGSHWKDSEFANKLGAVGVEDQLRQRKVELLASGKTAEAQAVNTLVGQPYSPIKTEAQYQQLKNAPEIVAALDRHKQTIQPLAETKQTKLGGALRSGGQDTGAFFNLIAKGVDSGEIHKARQGNQLATLKGGTRFGKEFKGTAAEYETDYRKMAERMVKGNWTEVEKQRLFDLVDSTGFGHLQKAGEDLPTFDKPMSPIPVQRRMAIIVKPGEKPVMKNQNETLWVPKSSEGEFRQAFQVDSPLKQGLLQAGSVLTKIQTSLGADAAIHVGNLGAAVMTSPEKVTAFKLVIQNLAKTFEGSPEVQQRLAAMAEEAGIVRQGENEVAGWRKLVPGKNMISWVDQAGRLTLDQLYKDAVKRGESPDNPIYRRAAVQGTLGEYNKRLMTQFQQATKDLGISPFLTAGKTLNNLSLKQLILSPGRKAADLQGGAKMRLKQALYATGLIVALPMVINQMKTGSPFPKGVQPGQFVVKKNEDGSYVVMDVAKLLMWRRGLRNSGIQAVAKGIEDKQSVGQIAMQAGKDVGRGLVHPFAGPGVSTADTLLGSGVMSDKPNKPFKQRAVDAAKQLNPTAAMLLDSDSNKTGSEKAIGGVGRVVGLSITANHVSRISGLAHQWMERNGVPVGNEPAGPYRDLTAALRKNDASEARKAVGELIASGKTDKEIKEYYKGIAQRTFTDSRKHEDGFMASLSDEDKEIYQKVKESNKVVRNRFYQMFLPNSPVPLDPLPRMPQREAMPSRFPLKR